MSSKNKKTVAFVYKWIELSTQKWYIGSRTAKGCHPQDGYICSSKVVKPLIQNNPEDWVRVVLETGEPVEMRKLEAEILTTLDAKNAPMSYNMQNGDGKFTTIGMVHSAEHCAKMSAALKGRKRKPFSLEHCAKISATSKGKSLSPEHRAKIGVAQKGKKRKPCSPESRAKIAAAKKGKSLNHEHRAKIGAAQKGKTKSPEHRAKIAATKIKTIIATNLSTGETFEINGKQEMKALGFNSGNVSSCARGVRASHKGHTFRFKDVIQED